MKQYPLPRSIFMQLVQELHPDSERDKNKVKSFCLKIKVHFCIFHLHMQVYRIRIGT